MSFMRAGDISRRIREYLEEQVAPLEEFVTQHSKSQAGEGGAINVPTAQDELDVYLRGTADVLLMEYDISPDEAFKYVFEKAKELADMAELPPMPDDDSGEEEVASWVSAAKSMAFAAYVLKAAHEEMSE